MTTDRRTLLLSSVGVFGLAACGKAGAQQRSASEAKFADSPYRKISDAQWKERLKPADSYRILRHEDTEPPGTGPFLNEKRKGTYTCRGCDLPMFKSEWKYDSRTGWPSYFDAIKENVGFKTDRLLGYARTEYHCAQCLGHHGHLFEDGPKPTGLRYCNNGYSLKFVPA